MIKEIIVCADDYAQNPSISSGIINLITQQRLSATSCLVTTPYWFEHAEWLKPYTEQIAIGLHFNLTIGTPLGKMPALARQNKFPALKQIILKSYAGLLNYEAVYAELNRQLEQFKKALGKLPDFIDGHQHIHCLPIIRQTLIDYYNSHFKSARIWLRNICPVNLTQLFKQPAALKKMILYSIGGKQFKKLLNQHNIPHNSSFAGIYNFNNKQHYADLFPTFLTSVKSQGLIMCHPGLYSNDDSDPINNTRIMEYEYFSSSTFLADCQKQQIQLIKSFY